MVGRPFFNKLGFLAVEFWAFAGLDVDPLGHISLPVSVLALCDAIIKVEVNFNTWGRDLASLSNPGPDAWPFA